MNENNKHPLRNPYGPLSILADLSIVIIVAIIYVTNSFTLSNILIGLTIIAIVQLISFIPGIVAIIKSKKNKQ